VLVPLIAAVLTACATYSAGSSTPATSAAPATSAPAGSTSTAPMAPVHIEADAFVSLAKMTKVRGLYLDNVLGRLDEAIAVANNPDGGVYPPGTIIQLIPQEAMLKREPGFSPLVGDWEFFELDVSATGTVIRKRGGAEVVNRFGGKSCAVCHIKAEERFDLVCEKTHGCDPLPIKDEVFIALQNTDPRPRG
jgi:hypothetical protein